MYLDTIFFSRKFHFGDRTISNMYEVLKNKIKNFEAQGIEIKINEDHKIVAVITPIMRRSHTMILQRK